MKHYPVQLPMPGEGRLFLSFLTNSCPTVSIEVAAEEVLQLPQAVCCCALPPSLLESFNPNICLKIITMVLLILVFTFLLDRRIGKSVWRQAGTEKSESFILAEGQESVSLSVQRICEYHISGGSPMEDCPEQAFPAVGVGELLTRSTVPPKLTLKIITGRKIDFRMDY